MNNKITVQKVTTGNNLKDGSILRPCEKTDLIQTTEAGNMDRAVKEKKLKLTPAQKRMRF